MPQKWAIWLAIEGDLRFLSHHDTVRAIERLARRAKLPLQYSQGFNPRPVMSLVLPRSVGLSAIDDLLVIALREPIEAMLLLERLNRQSPGGLRFLRAQALGRGTSPRVRAIQYELPLPAESLEAAGARMRELLETPAWSIERQTAASRPGCNSAPPTRPLDLRPLVSRLSLGERALELTFVPLGDRWARPGEVLRLLGLRERADLARMVRTSVDYGLDEAQPLAAG